MYELEHIKQGGVVIQLQNKTISKPLHEIEIESWQRGSAVPLAPPSSKLL